MRVESNVSLPASASFAAHAPRAPGSRGRARGWRQRENQGGDSTGAPPLPIPNREVKPRGADGTAKAGEQVTAALEAGRADASQSGRLPLFPPAAPGRPFKATKAIKATKARQTGPGKETSKSSRNREPMTGRFLFRKPLLAVAAVLLSEEKESSFVCGEAEWPIGG